MEPESAGSPVLSGKDAIRRAEEVVDRQPPVLALKALKELQALFPREARLYQTRAKLLESMGRDADAEVEYRKALSLDSSSDEIALDLVELLLDYDRLHEAEAFSAAVATRSPGNARAQGLLGDTRGRLGKTKEAEDLLVKAFSLDPEASWVARRWADILEERGDYARMLEVIGSALDAEPECPLNHGYLGGALKALGRVEEAIAAFRRALELDPAYAWAGRELSDLLADRGELDESHAIILDLLDRDPVDPYNYGYLGDLLLRRGRIEEGIEALQTATWLHAAYSWASRRLAGVLCELERRSEAREVLRRSLEADPGDAWTRASLEILERRSSGRG